MKQHFYVFFCGDNHLLRNAILDRLGKLGYKSNFTSGTNVVICKHQRHTQRNSTIKFTDTEGNMVLEGFGKQGSCYVNHKGSLQKLFFTDKYKYIGNKS